MKGLFVFALGYLYVARVRLLRRRFDRQVDAAAETERKLLAAHGLAYDDYDIIPDDPCEKSPFGPHCEALTGASDGHCVYCGADVRTDAP